MSDKKIKYQRMLIYVTLGFLTILSLLPFWLVFVNATRSSSQIQQGVSFLPSVNLKINWDILMGKGFNVFQGFLNSLIISVGATVLSVYFSALVAYAITAYEFKGKKIIFTVIIGLIMIPTQISIIGFYKLVQNLNLLNSFIPLILPAIASPATVFFLKQYLDTIYHEDFPNSARIEGANEITIFHKIMLPMLKPAMATTAIFSFVSSWNNLLMPLILITDQNKYTLPMLVQLLRANLYATEYGSIYLGISLSIIPLLVIYLILSKQIIGGVTAGGIKQ